MPESAPAPSAPDPSHDHVTSALAADALDALGLRSQCLGPDISPLTIGQRMVGRAFTVSSEPAQDPTPAIPYRGLMSALDALEPGSVFVFATGRSDCSGVWGELITTACLSSGVAGALTDGLIRDVAKLTTLSFPVFSRGSVPYDSKGRIDVTGHGQPVIIDGVTIAAGDLIVGDSDGVCVIPQAVEERVLARVSTKDRDEGQFRQAVAAGMRVSDAFKKYGVL